MQDYLALEDDTSSQCKHNIKIKERKLILEAVTEG